MTIVSLSANCVQSSLQRKIYWRKGVRLWRTEDKKLGKECPRSHCMGSGDKAYRRGIAMGVNRALTVLA